MKNGITKKGFFSVVGEKILRKFLQIFYFRRKIKANEAWQKFYETGMCSAMIEGTR